MDALPPLVRAMLAAPVALALAALSAARALPAGFAPALHPAARAAAALSDPDPGKARLSFGADGAFKLVVFNDLHYGEAENTLWGPQQDVKSTVVMNNVLEAEKPDFVVFNGDLITGENTFKENSTHYLDRVLAPTVQRKIPFATTYGNHDNDVNITHAALLARERLLYPTLSHTYLSGGSTPDGPGTYYLPVFAHHGTPGAPPALILWFFDSRAGKAYGTGAELQDWVAPQAVAWANATAAQMRRAWGALPPALAFVHIPTNASVLLQETVVTPQNGDDSGAQDPDAPELEFPGLNDDYPLASQDAEGYFNPSYTGADQPFIGLLRDVLGDTSHGNGRLFAVVSGHDHGDAWCATGPEVGNLTVCFGRHSGYGGYGSWARGGRVFEFAIGKDTLPSHIRMEDNSTRDAVVLGRGFGS